MKPILKTLGGHKVSRQALRNYCYYRHCGKVGGESLTDLENFHIYESTGKLPDGIVTYKEFTSSNKFAHGKWQAKLTQDMILEDYHNGNIVKGEFFGSKNFHESFGLSKFRYNKGGWFILNYLINQKSVTPFWFK